MSMSFGKKKKGNKKEGGYVKSDYVVIWFKKCYNLIIYFFRAMLVLPGKFKSWETPGCQCRQWCKSVSVILWH